MSSSYFIFLATFTWLFQSSWKLRSSDHAGAEIYRRLRWQILSVVGWTLVAIVQASLKLMTGWRIQADSIAMLVAPLALILPSVGGRPKWCTAIGWIPVAYAMLRILPEELEQGGIGRGAAFFVTGIFYSPVLIFLCSVDSRGGRKTPVMSLKDWVDLLPIICLSVIAGWGLLAEGIVAYWNGFGFICALVGSLGLAPTAILFPRLGRSNLIVKICALLLLIPSVASPLASHYSLSLFSISR